MRATKIPNGRQLPRMVMTRYAPTFDLVTHAICTDGIHIGVRVTRLFPAKGFAEEVFG